VNLFAARRSVKSRPRPKRMRHGQPRGWTRLSVPQCLPVRRGV